MNLVLIQDAMLECSSITSHYASVIIPGFIWFTCISHNQPNEIFFSARERKSHGPRDVLILLVRQLLFQEGTLHEDISFYKFSGDRQGVQKSLLDAVTFFLPLTSYHALVKCCSGNLQHNTLLPKPTAHSWALCKVGIDGVNFPHATSCHDSAH